MLLLIYIDFVKFIENICKQTTDIFYQSEYFFGVFFFFFNHALRLGVWLIHECSLYKYFIVIAPVQINRHTFPFFSVIYNEQVIIWKLQQFRIYTACDTGIWKIFEIALTFNFGSIFKHYWKSKSLIAPSFIWLPIFIVWLRKFNYSFLIYKEQANVIINFQFALQCKLAHVHSK